MIAYNLKTPPVRILCETCQRYFLTRRPDQSRFCGVPCRQRARYLRRHPESRRRGPYKLTHTERGANHGVSVSIAKQRAEDERNARDVRRLADEPTDAPPGSWEKVEVLRQRVTAGVDPWHPLDGCEATAETRIHNSRKDTA